MLEFGRRKQSEFSRHPHSANERLRRCFQSALPTQGFFLRGKRIFHYGEAHSHDASLWALRDD